MTAIFKREFKAYFTSPLGYLIIAVMALFEGIFFLSILKAGYADNEVVVSTSLMIVTFAVPVLTMRLFSEERKQKTDQILLTAPVSLWGIALGKFFSALAVYTLSFAPTFIYEIILTTKLESLNWMIYFGALFGCLLYGAALISVCMFISALTESQVVSAVLGIVASIILYMADSFASMTGSVWLVNAVKNVSFMGRYNTFYLGIIDFSNIVFFVSIAFFFIFLSVRMLEKKRWA